MAMDADAELVEHAQSLFTEWSSDSNEATTIQLVHNDGRVAASFQPEFTYPFFGEEEAIFGYQDLHIKLSFAAHNLRPHLSVEYSSQFPAQQNTRPTDIEAALRDFLPESAFTEQSRDDALHDAEASQFKPPGEKIHTYKRGKETYEVWRANLSDPNAKAQLENVQILMPMFIEGGSALELDYDWTTARWKVFWLYKVEPVKGTLSPYSLVGYGTSYRCFTLSDRQASADVDLRTADLDSLLSDAKGDVSPLGLTSRERLSQFLILPTYHKRGHGQELYNTMYTALTQPSNVREFTVEDPNEAFDDLRDLCDLLHLRKRKDFAALKIASNIPAERLKHDTDIPTDLIVSAEVRNKIMKETKIMQRQFDRLVEAHVLASIPPLHRSRNRITRREKASNEHDRAYYLWRLYAKHRLYIFNRDVLTHVERDERIEKLEAALDAVQEDYLELLEKVEQREKDELAAGGSVLTKRKKPTIEDDEDDEDDGDGGEQDEGQANGRKKARV